MLTLPLILNFETISWESASAHLWLAGESPRVLGHGLAS